ncbi:hypothetical protein [Photorhabdus hindustanensis]|uniref:Beta-ketoacyl synthase N-terminal domain-containing protein n=1 Tax=Photorhabdus hindustanensis TaxID=2918802 RepID=A0A2S8PVC1_9GAMM|nr:hypothetical protein [Photorhabdus hindustanensis]PQQ22851.1 hypothetical protein C6H66_21765 [Photorhabdus hindustanensis]
MLTFNVENLAIYPKIFRSERKGEFSLPADISEFVSNKGDRFRDDFSRVCTYLANQFIAEDRHAENESVIVGTEYGNLEAMLRFQRQVMNNDKTVSAQQFPYATTSSASTFINIDKKVTGGNCTLNAGSKTPVMVFMQALLNLHNRSTGASYLFFGDVYCTEALDDIRKKISNQKSISSGVMCATLLSGKQFTADFFFGLTVGEIKKRCDALSPDTKVFIYNTLDQNDALIHVVKDNNVIEYQEYNSAFLFHEFMGTIKLSKKGDAVVFIVIDNMNASGVRVIHNDD